MLSSGLARPLAVIALLGPTFTSARRAYNHQALGLHERQVPESDGPVSAYASPTAEGPVLTVITPSPGATPVAVTSQSQPVVSYVPQYTLCALPPVAEVEAFPTLRPSVAPYRNYSTSYTPSYDSTNIGSCTTVYSETLTTVCATTLSGLADRYTVSSCDQEITFSTQFGYTLATPTRLTNSTNPTSALNASSTITSGPSIQTLTTYFLAPWTELTSAGPPSSVDLKVCKIFPNGTEICAREFQSWATHLVSTVSTSILSINFTTQISGPSQLIVETITANITEVMTTYSLATEMATVVTVQTETTSTGTRGSVSTGSIVFKTYTVEEASPSIASTLPTSTTTVRITSTVHAGTTTETVHTSSATVAQEEVAATASASLDLATYLDGKK